MDSGSTLQRVVYKGLFGSAEGQIGIEADSPTVLTGANGSGKSTLLRLISAASLGDLSAISNAPVDYLRLEFSNIPPLTFNRDGERGPSISWGEHAADLYPLELEGLPSWAADALRTNGYDTESTLETLRETAQANGIPFHEFRKVRDLIHPDTRQPSLAWLDSFKAHFKVLFVTDQRLLKEVDPATTTTGGRRGPKQSSLAVEAASRTIRESLAQADSDYARSSQLRDRELPNTILQAMLPDADDVSVRDLEKLMAATTGRRESLKSVGLLDDSTFFEADEWSDQLADPNVRRAMGAVLATTFAKFGALDDLELRLSTFKKFLDERFTPKVVHLTRSEGMRFDTANTSGLSPAQLSSGEQQITVLAFEILFQADKGTLVIIDEPEISLHVLWQDSLIDDLVAMGRASGTQFLLATHSPTILASHPNLERSLGRSDEL